MKEYISLIKGTDMAEIFSVTERTIRNRIANGYYKPIRHYIKDGNEYKFKIEKIISDLEFLTLEEAETR